MRGLRVLLRKEEVSFQAVKTWTQSTDPDYEVKKNRVLELYDIADGKAEPGPADPLVVFSFDEFATLNLLPRAGKQYLISKCSIVGQPPLVLPVVCSEGVMPAPSGLGRHGRSPCVGGSVDRRLGLIGMAE
jgi:hypothetical protein